MEMEMRRTAYTSTSERGLAFDSVPLRLFQKAKRLGVWDPQAIDLGRDRLDWEALEDEERRWILRTLSLFLGGEEAVTLDLLPLVMAVGRQGHIEEEIYLTSFLWEEAKHVEWFRRWLNEVAGARQDLHHLMVPSWEALFYDELPRAMNALLKDDSPAAQARAAVTYNMIVEGVLAETGYYGIHRSIEERGILPGFVEGMRLVKRDESRHIRYGVYLLQRLISEDPAVWDVMQSRMNELFPTAMALIPEYWEAEGYMSDEGPMGVRMSELVAYAGSQFDTRMRILERDRGKTLREIERAVTRDMEEEEVEAAAR